jgi:hypothetical protein
MKTKKYSVVFIIILLFLSGCILKKDDDDSSVLFSNYHTNIIATSFSIVESGGVSAWGETTEINPYYCALPYNNETFNYYYDNAGFRPDPPYTYDMLSAKCKNRWIEIYYNGKVAYCQWEDVGPWFVDDYKYVFDVTGKTRPAAESYIGQKVSKYLNFITSSTLSTSDCNGAGIDLSPTLMKYLTGQENNKIKVMWRFCSEEEALVADPLKKYWAHSINNNAPLKNLINRVVEK